jgi:type II secretory pathway pseudopilin PulG
MALQSPSNPLASSQSPKPIMWLKLKDQIPAVIVTVVVLLIAGFFLYLKVSNDTAKQQAAMNALREQNNELRAASEDNRRQTEALNALLKDAIAKRSADALMTDDEYAKVNAEKINRLADAIAFKIQPFNPLPKTPEEAERLQNEQVDKVSTRMSEKIQPILAEMANDQHLTRDSIAAYSQRISDQVGVVLTTELAKNQQLNNSLLASQAVAHDSLQLSHEVTALYLSSFKDQGLITRLLSLPANVIKDATSLSIVNSSERRKIEARLVGQMNEIETRMNEVQAKIPKK